MNKIILSFLVVCALTSFGLDARAQVSLISKRPEYGRSVVTDPKKSTAIRLVCTSGFDQKRYENMVRIVYKKNVYYPKDLEYVRPKKENIRSLKVENDSIVIADYTMNTDVKVLFFIDSK